MCLSKLEYPPHGKRCGKLEHMTKEEIQAHKDATNERRRELYKDNKNREKIVKDFEGSSTKVATVYDTQVLMNVFDNPLKNLARDKVAYSMGNPSETFNDVYVLRMENGAKGYYKPTYHDEEFPENEYNIRPLQMMNNEAAAYQLSQALGGNYDGLVPETTIREYEGTVGSIQAEVIKAYDPRDIEDSSVFDDTHLKSAAIFDYISGSLDRHLDNFIIDEDMRINLIDNGMSFPEHLEGEDLYIHASDLVDTAFFAERKLEINEEDLAPVRRLLESKDSLGMDKFLTPVALESMRSRAQYLVDNGEVEDLIEYMNNFDEEDEEDY